MMKAVAKDTCVKELQHLSRAVVQHKVKALELSHKLTSLTNRRINSKKEARAAVHWTNQSTKHSKEVLAMVQVYEREMMESNNNSSQRNTIFYFEHKLDVAIKEPT